jgi:hypothetical protein
VFTSSFHQKYQSFLKLKIYYASSKHSYLLRRVLYSFTSHRNLLGNSCNSDPSMNTSIHDATLPQSVSFPVVPTLLTLLFHLFLALQPSVKGTKGSRRHRERCNHDPRSSPRPSPGYLHPAYPAIYTPSPASPFLQTSSSRRKLDPIPCKAVAGPQCMIPRAGFCGFHHSDFFPCRYDIGERGSLIYFDTVQYMQIGEE